MLEIRQNLLEWRMAICRKFLLPISQFPTQIFFYATLTRCWLFFLAKKADFDYWKIHFHFIAISHIRSLAIPRVVLCGVGEFIDNRELVNPYHVCMFLIFFKGGQLDFFMSFLFLFTLDAICAYGNKKRVETKSLRWR